MRERVEAAFDDRALLQDEEHREAVFDAVAALDRGELRVAQKRDGEWSSNAWVMKAINLYFTIAEMRTIEVGPFEYHDKIPTKKNLEEAGVRVVPPGTIRYGAFVEPGVVVMPGDRKSTRLNSSHANISYAVFCLKKKNILTN